MQAEKLRALNRTAINENLNFDSWTEEGKQEQGKSNSAPSSQEQLKSLFPLCPDKSLTSVKKIRLSLACYLWCQGRKLEKNYLSSSITRLLLQTVSI